MSQLLYSSVYSSQLTFSHPAKAVLNNLGPEAIPNNGVVMGVFYDVYAGIDASIRGQSVTASIKLTDTRENSVTISQTFTAPTESPTYIRIGGKPPASNVDYNHLARIQLGGTNKLVTRAAQNCPLYINYRAPLDTYTDPVLIPGETRIKAVHMIELHDNINIMRIGYGLEPVEFANIRAGYTSLGKWSDHVREMRAAIDEMGAAHESWIQITENRPKAAILEQLRRVVAGL